MPKYQYHQSFIASFEKKSYLEWEGLATQISNHLITAKLFQFFCVFSQLH